MRSGSREFATELGVSSAPPGVIIVSPRASLGAPRGFCVDRRCVVPRGTKTLWTRVHLGLARRNEWRARMSAGIAGRETTREKRNENGEGAATTRLREDNKDDKFFG